MGLTMAEPGRPAYTDDDYKTWLEAMTPFLKSGNSLYYAMEKAALIQHQTTIYEKYRLGDWFSEKIDRLRANMGELVNEGFYILITQITEKIKRGETLTKEEKDTMQFVAEKHRTAQPFFVTRTETAQVDPNKVGKILDVLEGKTDYDKLGQSAQGQVVADDAPIQNKG